jgi:hypothetical protein
LPERLYLKQTETQKKWKELSLYVLIGVKEESSEAPAIVIYMIDPFSYGNDNMDLVRLSSIGLLRFGLLQIKLSVQKSIWSGSGLDSDSIGPVVRIKAGESNAQRSAGCTL